MAGINMGPLRSVMFVPGNKEDLDAPGDPVWP